MDPASDFERAIAALPAARQEALRAAYALRAKNATAAFLTCYFLGLFGVHRMYLGEWGRAALRLALPALAALAAIVGLLAAAPPAIFLSIVGLPLLAGLAWELIDLARIDRQVNARNRALAGALLAGGGRPAGPPGIDAADIARARSWAEAATARGTLGAFAADAFGGRVADVPTTPGPPVETESYAPGLSAPLDSPLDDEREETAPEWPASLPPSATPDEREDGPDEATQPRIPALRPWPPASRPPIAAEAVPVAEPPPPPAPRAMKRIRVRRKILLDGEVVGEQVIEELIPADADTQAAAAALQSRLARMTPEEIAALAHLPPGVAVEFRDRSGGARS